MKRFMVEDNLELKAMKAMGEMERKVFGSNALK